MKHTFNIEVTDTYGDEANYSWVRRYTVTAKSFRGAIMALSRQHGGYWKFDYNLCNNSVRYNQRGAAVCAFIEYANN